MPKWWWCKQRVTTWKMRQKKMLCVGNWNILQFIFPKQKFSFGRSNSYLSLWYITTDSQQSSPASNQLQSSSGSVLVQINKNTHLSVQYCSALGLMGWTMQLVGTEWLHTKMMRFYSIEIYKQMMTQNIVHSLIV